MRVSPTSKQWEYSPINNDSIPSTILYYRKVEHRSVHILLTRLKNTRREGRMVRCVRIVSRLQTHGTMLQWIRHSTPTGYSSTQFAVYTINAHSVVDTSIRRPLSLSWREATWRSCFGVENPDRKMNAWSIPTRPSESIRLIAGESVCGSRKSMQLPSTETGQSRGIISSPSRYASESIWRTLERGYRDNVHVGQQSASHCQTDSNTHGWSC